MLLLWLCAGSALPERESERASGAQPGDPRKRVHTLSSALYAAGSARWLLLLLLRAERQAHPHPYATTADTAVRLLSFGSLSLSRALFARATAFTYMRYFLKDCREFGRIGGCTATGVEGISSVCVCVWRG